MGWLHLADATLGPQPAPEVRLTLKMLGLTRSISLNSRWRIGGQAGTSIYELSFYFFKQVTFTVPTALEINRGHFISIAVWLRHCMHVVKKQGISLFPPQAKFDARRAL